MSDHPIEDLQAGEAWRQKMKEKASGWHDAAPWWYGWVVMDSFLEGLRQGRLQEREACARLADYAVHADITNEVIAAEIRKRGQP